MKPRVLAVMNDPEDPLGRIGDYLEAESIVPEIYEPYRLGLPPRMKEFDILIILGGRMDVWDERDHPWLARVKEMIREWVLVDDKPTLAICLGHQLVADALGGTVAKASPGEAHVKKVMFTAEGRAHPIFKGFSAHKLAICWHGSEVTSLPAGATRLAFTSACKNASFSFGSATIGLQYHIEASPMQIDDWLRLPDLAIQTESIRGVGGIQSLSKTAAKADTVLASNSRRLYDNFMSLARGHTGRERLM